jgi:DNA ligase-1
MQTFKPLLAYTVDTQGDPDALKKLSYPVMASPKLDGIRIMNRGALGPVTRTWKEVPNDKVRKFLSRPELEGFDGEIIFGPVFDEKVFNTTQSAVMKIEGPCMTEGGVLWVFDDFTNKDAPFEERFASAERRVLLLPPDLKPYVQIVPHAVIHNDIDLANYEAIQVGRGAEGAMVRDPAGKYKMGRSTARGGELGKIKRFTDAEATIIGFEEMMHNDNDAEKDAFGRTKRSSSQEGLRPAGTLGKLLLECDRFTETFACGSGFSAALKQEIWDNQHELLGAEVTFKYQECGSTGERPRLPIFKGFRKDHR